MPLIPVPSNEELIPQTVVTTGVSTSEYARIKAYLDCPDWKCIKCGAVMFGRCKECVYCRLRLNVITPRPESYRD